RTSSKNLVDPNTTPGSPNSPTLSRSTPNRWSRRSASGTRISDHKRPNNHCARPDRRFGRTKDAPEQAMTGVLGGGVGTTLTSGSTAMSNQFRELRLDQVSRHFHHPTGSTISALNELTIDIKRGEFVALLGPSGCGKTTALNCVAGLM